MMKKGVQILQWKKKNYISQLLDYSKQINNLKTEEQLTIDLEIEECLKKSEEEKIFAICSIFIRNKSRFFIFNSFYSYSFFSLQLDQMCKFFKNIFSFSFSQ